MTTFKPYTRRHNALLYPRDVCTLDDDKMENIDEFWRSARIESDDTNNESWADLSGLVSGGALSAAAMEVNEDDDADGDGEDEEVSSSGHANDDGKRGNADTGAVDDASSGRYDIKEILMESDDNVDVVEQTASGDEIFHEYAEGAEMEYSVDNTISNTLRSDATGIGTIGGRDDPGLVEVESHVRNDAPRGRGEGVRKAAILVIKGNTLGVSDVKSVTQNKRSMYSRIIDSDEADVGVLHLCKEAMIEREKCVLSTVITVVKGKIKLVLDGNPLIMEPGGVALLPRGAVYSMEGIGGWSVLSFTYIK